ncbi:MAG: YbhB/YbcL family Raf kinase inhibitor-like protein [Deltaproteobacteria bacterium]|nr:YbhB/YbcL family Raf kinase inhibitor-like protein [Deltaproteobacteria bacterium]
MKFYASLIVLALLAVVFSSNISIAKEETAMQLKSTVFEDNGLIPKKYTCDGSDVSPPLTWSKPPVGTKSIVLICDDPDAPMGTWVHWTLYGLSPETTSLPENVPKQKEVLGGARQGITDFRKIGYGGPCQPKGPAHRYFFKIYALDIELNLPAGATKQDMEKAMKGHILAEGQLVGKYGR